jgi:hypothetical protein
MCNAATLQSRLAAFSAAALASASAFSFASAAVFFFELFRSLTLRRYITETARAQSTTETAMMTIKTH